VWFFAATGKQRGAYSQYGETGNGSAGPDHRGQGS
jgi:hypothetical protein